MESEETNPKEGGLYRDHLPAPMLGILLGSRILTNMSIRVLYPFLSTIACGLGISLAPASCLASMHGGGRMAAPPLGYLSDRYGRRRVMQLSLLLLSAACATVYFNNLYSLLLFAFAGISLGRAMFDPSVQAYLGERRLTPCAVVPLPSFPWPERFPGC